MWLTGNSVDFEAFYVAGRAVLTGNADRLYDLAWTTVQDHRYASQVVAFLFPPAYALLFAPFALLPITLARVLWILGSLMALVLTIRVARGWTSHPTLTLAAACALFVPVGLALVMGQTTLWMLFVFALLCRREWQGRTGFSTGMIAGLALCKPQMLLPLAAVWVSRRRGGALLGLLVAAMIVAALSAAVSLPASVAFVRDAPALAARVRSALEVRGSTAAVLPALGPIGIAIGAALLMLLLGAWHEGAAEPYRMAALWVSPMLATPHLGAYGLALALLPVSLLPTGARKDVPLTIVVALIWFAPIVWLAGLIWAPAVSLLSLFALSTFRAIRAQAPAARVARIKP